MKKYPAGRVRKELTIYFSSYYIALSVCGRTQNIVFSCLVQSKFQIDFWSLDPKSNLPGGVDTRADVSSQGIVTSLDC